MSSLQNQISISAVLPPCVLRGTPPNEQPTKRAARFWGTLSYDIPRGAKIECSGYAAFRNKNRPTIFGVQIWDATMHPYLAIKLRNRRAAAAAVTNH
ncbi:unnamed protein product [Tilletia caries]|uniref:Uncharacterized protein n=2 Tax=Tilletia TaxID=13289 RepID=A0A8X7SUY4_9BASI|nr:hypothetical protein CF336_g6571 [Tilletia laevis]KAE8189888.1 hypothetical protein CF328_g6140 [Tilletia controversa]KAE8253647.1 hypothetical protein A4X03_0g5838 [Tilletia caries]KAE8191402.1 hypothetical protein CF335_g6098 [Tilletia laevis]KAE8243213.1 hypothetical protein A4X06_0g6473 [Tilletia controversa]